MLFLRWMIKVRKFIGAVSSNISAKYIEKGL